MASDSSEKFSIKEALCFGWEKTKEYFLFWLAINLFLSLFVMIGNFLLLKLAGAYGFETIFRLILGILMMILELGFLRITLDFVEQERSSFLRLFSQYPLFLKYFLASILKTVIVIMGLILLIIPGVILEIGLTFYSYLIVDLGLGPILALKKSWAITKGAKLKLFGFFILMGIINLFGALLLLVGLLVTVPVTSLALAYVYRKLLSAQAGAKDLHPEPALPHTPLDLGSQ